VEAQAIKVKKKITFIAPPFYKLVLDLKRFFVDDFCSKPYQRVHRIGQTKPITGKEVPTPSFLFLFLIFPFSVLTAARRQHAVKTLAIRNSAEELMISRRAQLKSQDQKVGSLTDDFTMRNFIAVGLKLPFTWGFFFPFEQRESHVFSSSITSPS
jgi:hypothetical protein